MDITEKPHPGRPVVIPSVTAEADFISSHSKRLQSLLGALGVEEAGAWTTTATARKIGKNTNSQTFDAYYHSPQGHRHRSLTGVRQSFEKDQNTSQQCSRKPSSISGAAHLHNKRVRVVPDYKRLDGQPDEDQFLPVEEVLNSSELPTTPKLKEALEPKIKVESKNGEQAKVRPNKAEAATDFDPKRNPYRSLLSRVKAQISRLCHEQHLLQTLTADANKFGSNKKVKQTHEMRRAKEQVAKSKQIVRDCLKKCEDADGHKPIASDCFDEEGQLDSQHILCSACTAPEADDVNDILLCDGEFCDRAYHVSCLPVKESFHIDNLPEEEGWLCPACDCRADIMWEVSQAFELDFDHLIKARWSEVLISDECLADLAEASGPKTILNQDLASEDEDDDEDFGGEDSDEDANDADDPMEADAPEDPMEADAPDDPAVASTSAPQGDGEDSEEESGDSESGDSDFYEDDSDDESGGTGMEAMLTILKEESEKAPEDLMVCGKRQRTKVDYLALNEAMFGGTECYEGEGTTDKEFDVKKAGHGDDDLPVRKKQK